MLLTINAETHRDEWVLYTLTNGAGECLAVNVVKYVDIADVPIEMLPPTGTLYLTVLDSDTDRMRLANRAIELLGTRGLGKFQWSIRDIVAAWGREGSRKSGSPVMCVETGQTWSSVTDCARDGGLTYSQLSKHLKGEIGYKTVKGQTYKKL